MELDEGVSGDPEEGKGVAVDGCLHLDSGSIRSDDDPADTWFSAARGQEQSRHVVGVEPFAVGIEGCVYDVHGGEVLETDHVHASI